MKYVAFLLVSFALVACSDSPTTMIGADASTDSSVHNDASLDAGTQDAHIVTDAATDATTSDATVDATVDATGDAAVADAGELDATVADDASVSDASVGDGGVSAEVMEFVENMMAAQMNFTTATCHCQYAMFEFASEEACTVALAPETPSECYQVQWTMHWEEMGPRMECIRAAHDAYYTCISGGTCSMEQVTMCEDAHGESFFGCLDIASDLSASIDEICGAV